MKKRFILGAFLSLIVSNIFGQFAPEQIIQPETLEGPQITYCVDLDGDGDLDILIGAIFGDQIGWIENFGDGEYSEQHIISRDPNGLKAVFWADLDGDGDNDVIYSSVNNDVIAWYENLGGAVFGTQKIISTSIDSPSSIYCSDIDGDSDADIVIGTSSENKIVWFENLGSGVFSTDLTLAYYTGNILDIIVADLDNDSDGDIIVANYSQDEIVWFENISAGVFSTENMVTSLVDGVISISCVDINGDSLIDIVSASNFDNKVAWYKNLGSGSFSSQKIISLDNDEPASIYCDDLDSDGDIDVRSTSPGDYKVAWYKNLGSDIFSSQIVIETLNGPYDVCSGDLDIDGDVDIITVSRGNHQVILFDNLGIDSFATYEVISTSAIGASAVYATDLDNDGDLDVLSASTVDRKIAWYENLGGFFAKQKVITTVASGAQSVYSADLDGDGDQDVLSASSNDDKIAWYENLGSGNFSTQNIITSTANGATSIYSQDLDGDGDMDVLSASFNSSTIGWYENLGGGSFSLEKVIFAGASRARSVFASDLDNDGDFDVLSASSNDDEVAWYENLGNGTFSTQKIISEDSEEPWCVYASDLDDDGDMDVISASYADGKIAWYENYGTGRFSKEIILTTSANNVKSVFSADLDNDGDMDIISGSSSNGNIVWFENYGIGIFGDEQLISMDGNLTHSVFCADLDSDGDNDILTAVFENESKIGWYKNLAIGGVLIQGSVYQDADSNCTNDDSGLAIFGNIVVTPGPYYTRADSNGNYSVLIDTGTYTISSYNDAVLDEYVNSICPNNHYASFKVLGSQVTGIDFGYNIELCQKMEVNIVSTRRRRCFRNKTTVKYCNRGFVDAPDVKLNVVFPEYVVPISSSVPWDSKQDSILVWDIGLVQSGECNQVDIVDSVICGIENIRGLAQCTKAIISPSKICDSSRTIDPTWDQSDIRISSDCNVLTDEIAFTIKNKSQSMDMNDSAGYQIFFNDTIVKQSKYKLQAGEEIHIKVPSYGQTVRLDAWQHEEHPWSPKMREIREGCYSISNFIDTGHVTSVGLINDNYAEHTSCMEIIDSYDPNDKQPIPEGIGNNYGILKDEKIEYTIRFQNTGSDTAYKIIITDTLDNNLDFSTIRFNGSSHSSNIKVSGYENPIITWVFNNIFLPDSTTDNLGSNGFVKFTVMPKVSITAGEIIENVANIFFDYNSPIITNSTIHTIIDMEPVDLNKGNTIQVIKPFVTETVVTEKEPLTLFPNPVRRGGDLFITGNDKNFDYTITDLTGSIVLKGHSKNGSISLSERRLSKGIYIYTISNEHGFILNGKLIIN